MRLLKNRVQEVLIDSATVKLQTTPEYREWEARYLAAEAELTGYEAKEALSRLVWDAIHLHSEAMFLMGWELRGNPDAMFDLPNGD